MNPVQLERLLDGLRSLPGEREWVEFKENNESPEMIGETAAALSNSARLRGEPFAYMVWGVRDSSHEIVVQSSNRPRRARATKSWSTGWYGNSRQGWTCASTSWSVSRGTW